MAKKEFFSIGGAVLNGGIEKLGGPKPVIIDLDKASDPFALLANSIGKAVVLMTVKTDFSNVRLPGGEDLV